MHDHHLGEEGSLGFAAGSKKLQQSSNLVEDLDQGVKFIPSAKYVVNFYSISPT